MSDLIKIGSVRSVYKDCVGVECIGKPIMQSKGLITHVQKRHPQDVQYLAMLPSILSDPDYVGVNPRETVKSFEIVKHLSDNIQVGVKISKSGNYFYVATLFTITDAKLQRNIASGRLTKV